MSEVTDPGTADDIALISRIDAVPTILQILSDTTGLGFATITRVTGSSWTACAVLDRISFGLPVGGKLDVLTTLCREIHASGQPIVIEHASTDPLYCGHPTPKQYGFESYIAVPIARRTGEVFGTLCALDPKPAALPRDRLLPTLQLFAQLIAAQIDIEERLGTNEVALTTATEVSVLREQFIAVLGHDLRSPLASVEAGLSLLSRSQLDPASTEVVDHMKRSCRRMWRLIGDILDFARGRLGGGIPVALQTADGLADTLTEVIDEFRSTHPDRKIEASFAYTAPSVCDPARIAQLLANLLANALAHGAEDTPVKVSVHGRRSGLTLTVTNRGAPIPPETMSRLFEPFVRMKTEAPQAGLGLGLYIAAEIARAHRGTLTASSTQEATTFRLDVPGSSLSTG
jgi:signal transduction histidine kinase